MYAMRKHYVKNWDHTPDEERFEVEVTRGGKPDRDIQPERIASIEEESMYWRKANHIHAWFVDNVQDGNDDCKEYFVACDQLRELFAVCETVIQSSNLVEGDVYAGTVCDKDHPEGKVQRRPGKVIEDATVAAKLLPTRSGFFFGPTEYDEYYLDDVVRTRDWAGQMITQCENGTPGDIVYSSSW